MSGPNDPECYDYEDEPDDYDEEDGYDAGEECGRWDNERLTHNCTKAGSEECDWECPYRGTLPEAEGPAEEEAQSSIERYEVTPSKDTT